MSSHYADIVIQGGKVYTMDEKKPYADTVAIKGDKIVYVGNYANDLIGRDTIVIDAEGKSVLPGFIDTHVHLVGTAFSKFDDLNVFGMHSLHEILRSIKHIRKPKGAWIRVGGFDDSMVMEQRYPTRWELDSVSPNNPIIIKRIDGHSCIVNTVAMEKIGLGLETRGVEVNERGLATGVLRAEANEIARRFSDYEASREELLKKLLEVSYEALKSGVTTIHALEGSTGNPSYVKLLMEENLPLDLVIYYQTTNVKEALALGLPRIGGCILVDGSMDSHTAMFFEPYNDRRDTRGVLYFDESELKNFILSAHKKGIQIAMHAIGDAAIEQLLNAYEYAIKEQPREDHRHRIEHAEVPTYDQISRIAKLDIYVAVQPSFLYYWDIEKFYLRRLGKERTLRLHPYKRMIQAGIHLSGGSDSPVTPIDPLIGIYSAVNHPIKGSSISILEALKLYTIEAAAFSFDEGRKGSISEGKVADLIILSDDILKLKKEDIRKLSVEVTIRKGEIVVNKLKL